MLKIQRTGGRIFLLLVVTLFGTSGLLAQEAQAKFGAEEPINQPAKIPAPILAQLKRDKRVRQCVSRKNQFKSNWFSAAIVDLNGDQVDDYVVKAENACLFGANLAPFWVFHNLTHRYAQVLRADTLALEILPEKTEDYRDIKLSRATAANVIENTLKFNGKQYR